MSSNVVVSNRRNTTKKLQKINANGNKIYTNNSGREYIKNEKRNNNNVGNEKRFTYNSGMYNAPVEGRLYVKSELNSSEVNSSELNSSELNSSTLSKLDKKLENFVTSN